MATSGALAQRAFNSGALIGGCFRIDSMLGEGGMGAVYAVRDTRSGRQLALKQLRADEAHHPHASALFEREYHTLCHLAHPCIVSVYDYGIEQGSAYYTMELLDGEDLRERGKLSWQQACSVLRDLASSLAILHSRRLLHRDLSLRNVRCTKSSRAKLIDFGAMTPMGIVKHVAGTAPFVPPEALQLQALDGRADLYALGALGYWMLTGRHAYPARNFDQLRELWRSPAAAPRHYVPEIPAPLDKLILELLQLDRAERPATAAEVMERVSGIAGLPLSELPAVTQAYLVTPMLVGREAILEEARTVLCDASRGRGASVLFSGPAGVGRSRILDACVLEAKLLGATVVRGDASDSADGDYGLVKSLARQLSRELPEVVRHSAEPWREVLLGMVPDLGDASVKSQPPAERSQLQSAWRNWLLSVARRTHLVIAVDDVDAIDEPSAAVLSALAHNAKRRSISLLLTARSDAAGPALALLREAALPIAIDPLSELETETLLRSVFGDVDRVTALARRLHSLSQGNVSWTMATCEQWVERRLVRYEAGSWLLPAELDCADLPESFSAAIAARLASLPDDARRLAEALSLTEACAFSLEDCASLTEHRDPRRTFGALEALVAAAVLVPAGDGYRFAQRELAGLLQRELQGERRRELHDRIARVLAPRPDPVVHAHHLLLAGRGREAIERLLVLIDQPSLRYSSLALDVLERAVLVAAELELPWRVQLELRNWIVTVASLLGQYQRFERYALPLLEQVQRESALSDYLELGPGLPPALRLVEACRRAEERYQRTPEAERGFPPSQAVFQLGRLCANFVTMAAVSMQLAPLERLPSLAPLFPLSLGLRTTQAHIDCLVAMQSARYDVVRVKAREILDALARDDHGGVDPLHAEQLRLGCQYMLGLMAAAIAHPSTREYARELEDEPGHRVLAWRMLMVHELALGNQEAATESRQRAELLQLQDGGVPMLPGTTSGIELQVYLESDDIIGVKRMMERLDGLAATYPGWLPWLHIARSHYRRLQGDLEAALRALAPALELTAPGRDQAWSLGVAGQLGLLTALGQHERAVAIGLAALEACAAQELWGAHHALQRVVAESLLRAGDVDAARALADQHLDNQRQSGGRGLRLGLAYETRARVAIAMHDELELTRFAELCAREYKGGQNLLLNAKYQRLLREAEAYGIALDSDLQHALDPDALAQTAAAETANRRLLVHRGRTERADEALRLLLEVSGAAAGVLFQVRNGRLDARTLAGDVEPTPELPRLLESYLRDALTAEADVTMLDSGAVSATGGPSFADAMGRSLEPLVLAGRHDGKIVVSALVLLHYATPRRSVLHRDMLETLSNGLLEADSAA
jgi:anti-anti-sigma regulatory factor